MTPPPARKPLIVHVVHRFAVGGMENGVVNLLNRLPNEFADHCVVALADADPRFKARLRRADVSVFELHKPPGQTARILPRLYRLLRQLRPTVVHTRNVGTLEAQLAAWLAGVPVRIHGEHGWDVGDLGGTNRRMLWLRRLLKGFTHHQVALSGPTQRYLVERVGVPPQCVTNICNGVDTERFSPAPDRTTLRARLAGPALPDEAFVIGAVGRVAPVKNLPLLIDAFAQVRVRNPAFARLARLAIVGDGPAAPAIREQIRTAGLQKAAWLPGSREDIPDCLRCLDVLCLPSLVEGISNTVLEAMACGIPVVATDVGGNSELVDAGATGQLVACGDAAALATAIETYFTDRARLRVDGTRARSRAVTQFSLQTMIDAYHRLYLSQLQRAGVVRAPADGPLNPRPSA